MKILLGNNTLSLLAGSETWTYALALALKKAGHEVSCFASILGQISIDLEKEGIPCFDIISTKGVEPFSIILKEEHKHEYDVIFSNHWNIVEYLRSQFPTTPIVCTIHGIMHQMEDETGATVDAPEHPAMNSGVNQFVAVSEEVQKKLKDDYNLESIVVRNFIDTKHFKFSKVNKKPKEFLVNTNYAFKDDPEILVLREVAKHYGAKLAAIGQNFIMTKDTMKSIKNADIVIGMGRSVLEGVSMGRLGIVHGRWGTAGIINKDNVESLKTYNFSGRDSKGKTWTKGQFIEEIDKNYKTSVLEWGKTYIGTNHNVSMAVNSYIEIAKSLLGQNIVKDNRRPFIRARDKNVS